MDSKALKLKLKSVREFIDNKDFNKAKGLCQEIVQCNENEYMALLFLGLAESELGNKNESRESYLKAVRTDSNKVQAWMGLHKLYSENEDVQRDELFLETLNILLKNQPTLDKMQIYLKQKLELTAFLRNLEEFNDAVKLLLENNIDVSMALNILRRISQFDQIDSITKSFGNSCLATVATSKPTDLSQVETSLIAYINKHADWRSVRSFFIESRCWSIHLKSLGPFFALGVILEYVQVCDVTQAAPISNELSNEMDILQSIDLDLTDFNQIISFMLEEEWEEGFDLVEEVALEPVKCVNKVVSQIETLLHVCVLMHSHHYNICLSKLDLICKLIQENGTCFLGRCVEQIEGVWNKLMYWRMHACLQIYSLDNAKTLYETYLSKQTGKYFDKLKCRYLISVGDYESALSLLDSSRLCVESVMLNLAQNNVTTELIDRFTEVIGTELPDICEVHFLLGKCMWTLGDRGGNVVKEFLSAAKLDSRDWRPFEYLGRYYMHHAHTNGNDISGVRRAIRCYEQAWDIMQSWGVLDNGVNDVTIKETSDAYCFDSASANKHAQFLKHAIEVEPSCAVWASLRFGEMQLQSNDIDAGVCTLQKLVSMHPNNASAWMTLADAYVQRGSFESAIKSLSAVMKLIENDDEHINTILYAQYKLASINCSLAKYEDSISASSMILKLKPHYLPAVVLYAEANYKYAHLLISESRLVRAGDHVLCAFNVLQEFLVQMDPECKTVIVWKLLGDCLVLMITQIAQSSKRTIVLNPNFMQLIGVEKCVSATDVLGCSSRCYMQSVQCQPSIASLWFDLSLSLYLLATSCQMNTKYFAQAESASIRCLSLDASNFDALCLLSMIYASQKSFPKAQHCLISALEKEQNSANAWTLLGILYLQHEEVQLSHKCIVRAQSIDPLMPQPWCMMALIADKMGDFHESADLFRHASSISCLPLAISKYAHCVLQSLKESGNHSHQHLPDSILSVSDRLSTISGLLDNPDYCSTTLLCLVNELVGLDRKALRITFQSPELESKLSDLEDTSMNLNRCRLAGKLGQSDTFRKYSKRLPDDLVSVCMKSVALARLGDMDKATETFESAVYFSNSKTDSENISLSIALCKAISCDKSTDDIENGIGPLIVLVSQYYANKICFDNVRSCFSRLIRLCDSRVMPLAFQLLSVIWPAFSDSEKPSIIGYLIHLFPFNSICQRLYILQNYPDTFKIEDCHDLLSVVKCSSNLKRHLQQLLHYWPCMFFIQICYVLLICSEYSKICLDPLCMRRLCNLLEPRHNILPYSQMASSVSNYCDKMTWMFKALPSS